MFCGPSPYLLQIFSNRAKKLGPSSGSRPEDRAAGWGPSCAVGDDVQGGSLGPPPPPPAVPRLRGVAAQAGASLTTRWWWELGRGGTQWAGPVFGGGAAGGRQASEAEVP